VTAVRQVVLDASVGVKWFRDEPGSAEARELLLAHGRGETQLVVPSLFVYEVVAVATRTLSAADARVFWERFMSWRLSVVEVGGDFVSEVLAVRERLGCSFCDAASPALAAQLDTQLYSADARAHAQFAGVQLI